MVGSQVEYARHAGISKQAVNKMVQAGRIPRRADGKIDFAEADRARARNGDPARRMGAPSAPAPAAVERDEDGGAVAEAPAPAAPETGGLSFARARTAREAYQARIAQLEYEQKIGGLLPRREIEDAMVASGRKIRQGLDGIVCWADEIDAAARNGGSDAVRTLLRSKVREVEELIVQGLNLLADDDA